MQKKINDKLVEKCAETNNQVKVAKITLVENENKNKRSSCTLYIVLFQIIFTINVGIGSHFVCYKYMNCSKETDRKEKIYFQATIIRRNSIEFINGTSQRNEH